MSDQLSSAQIEEYRSVFSHFDKQNSGSIDIKALKLMMRALGEDLSDQDLVSMCQGGKSLDANTFVQNRQAKWAKEQSGEEVKAAFQVFDSQGDGTIHIDELRRLMTTMGEVMNDQEAGNMIKDAGGGPKVDYNSFVEKMKRKT